MNTCSLVIRYLTSRFSSVISNTVFFDSFQGQYSDNPKYISQEVHRIMPDVKIVWSVSDKTREVMPDYIKKVQYGSKEYYNYALNSAAVVDNNMGIRSFGFRNFDSRMLRWILKKPGQLAIATWHGTPLKKIGKDQLNRSAKTFFTGIDYCIYGCDITRDAVGEAFFVKDIMRPYGSPRNDQLVSEHSNEEIEALKVKLGLPLDKRIVLFAPTFRKDIGLSGLRQLDELNIKKLLLVFKAKFNQDFAFVFRAHHSVLEKTKSEGLLDQYGIIDGNIGDDMTEYLMCTDILLTDYSSCMFDIALTDKPCFLYVPDLDHYRDDERGMYLNFSDLPFPNALDPQSLYSIISEFDYNLYLSKKNSFLESINNIETGEASTRVAKDIVKHINGEIS